MLNHYDLVVIGGGPAGMAAAIEARKQGIQSILIIERDKELGGILNQCIHNGFGVHHFKEELTGPEYSSRIMDEVNALHIDYIVNSMVLQIEHDKIVHVINESNGYQRIQTKTIVLAMGCRERARGAINIYGSRPAGIFTAGTAQRLVNLDGYMPGQKAVILGSGDIGLIMARRMTLEGATVEAVLEIMPHSNGLPRNIVQCLHDFDIPLLLSHTVVRVHGTKRVEGVTIAKVDQQLEPINETERFIPCDTLLLSVGLIPENEISRMAGVEIDSKTRGPIVDELRQTNQVGIFACGNVLHVHDVVDYVSEEGRVCGRGVAKFIQNQVQIGTTHTLTCGDGVSYVLPQRMNVNNLDDQVKIYLRVNRIFRDHAIEVLINDALIAKKKAAKFAPAEMVSFSIKKEDLISNGPGEIVVRVRSLEEKGHA